MIAGLNVADEHGRARDFLKSVGDSIEGFKGYLLGIVELHFVLELCREGGVWLRKPNRNRGVYFGVALHTTSGNWFKSKVSRARVHQRYPKRQFERVEMWSSCLHQRRLGIKDSPRIRGTVSWTRIREKCDLQMSFPKQQLQLEYLLLEPMGFHVREAIYGMVKKRADKRDSLGIENWVVTARASNDKVISPFKPPQNRSCLV